MLSDRILPDVCSFEIFRPRLPLLIHTVAHRQLLPAPKNNFRVARWHITKPGVGIKAHVGVNDPHDALSGSPENFIRLACNQSNAIRVCMTSAR